MTDVLTPPSVPPPGKVQAIGVMHLIGGVFNLIAAFGCAAAGLWSGLWTFGIGCLACFPVLLLLPIGVAELVSGARHLSGNHVGLRPPKALAIAEICCLLSCSMSSGVFGVLTLVFLSDPEVEAYYSRMAIDKQLTG